jgi:enoyl-CoA hydratase/carnithine racemase
MKLNTDKMIAEKEGHIGWITFNNPARRNAVSLEMWEALGVIVSDFQQDDNIRVIVLKGAGDKAFVSGADISEFEEKRNSPASEEEYAKKSALGSGMLYQLDKPLIAMIQGFCIGGGLAIALSADIRFATDDSKFGIPAAKLGLGYGYSGIKILSDLVGPSHAKDILFTARFMGAEEALRIGLINRIVSRDELESTVRDYARMIANNAPLTVKTAKAAVREAIKDPEDRDLARIAKMVDECFDSKDYAEGRSAFMEKRKPVFIGE